MSALPAKNLMSIGDALSLLKPQFPDLTISKLRYLETEGLVDPQRTSSGYRKYSHADVQRLRYILGLQRDQYLPLRVIKEQLEAIDRGLDPQAAGGVSPRAIASVDSLPAPADFAPTAALRMSTSELLSAAGASNEQLAGCQQFGLIQADAHEFDADDLTILKTVAALESYGIEPRHLRAFKMAADREVGLVNQVVAPLRRKRDPEAPGRADDVARDVAALAAALHIALVRSLLDE